MAEVDPVVCVTDFGGRHDSPLTLAFHPICTRLARTSMTRGAIFRVHVLATDSLRGIESCLIMQYRRIMRAIERSYVGVSLLQGVQYPGLARVVERGTDAQGSERVARYRIADAAVALRPIAPLLWVDTGDLGSPSGRRRSAANKEATGLAHGLIPAGAAGQ